MGILRADRITGLGGANAITGSVFLMVEQYWNYLSVDRKDDDFVNLSTNDFTIEFWIYSRRNLVHHYIILLLLHQQR